MAMSVLFVMLVVLVLFDIMLTLNQHITAKADRRNIVKEMNERISLFRREILSYRSCMDERIKKAVAEATEKRKYRKSKLAKSIENISVPLGSEKTKEVEEDIKKTVKEFVDKKKQLRKLKIKEKECEKK